MAGSIGVAVELRGEAPKEDQSPEERRIRSLLAQAIRECAVNAVKHAGGDRLCVEITEISKNTDDLDNTNNTENKESILVAITNNGKPPKGPIAESGGLLSLRRSVESAGGEMRVESSPNFLLILRF